MTQDQSSGWDQVTVHLVYGAPSSDGSQVVAPWGALVSMTALLMCLVLDAGSWGHSDRSRSQRNVVAVRTPLAKECGRPLQARTLQEWTLA